MAVKPPEVPAYAVRLLRAYGYVEGFFTDWDAACRWAAEVMGLVDPMKYYIMFRKVLMYIKVDVRER